MKKHCKTCACTAPKQCVYNVPASDYRSSGRCIKRARANHDMCGIHIEMGARRLHAAMKATL